MAGTAFVPNHIHFLATVTLERPASAAKIATGWFGSLLARVQSYSHAIWHGRKASNPLLTADNIEEWLVRLVDGIGMRILAGPYVVDCLDPGNEGVSGIVVLSTSHCSLHVWDQVPEPYLKIDLYSCEWFDVEMVLIMLKELGARVCDYEIIDRNHTNEENLLAGSMYVLKRSSVDFRIALPSAIG